MADDYAAEESAEKPKKEAGIDEQRLLAAIDSKLSGAYGAETNSTLAQTRTDAIEYYLGLNVKPAPEGRSQIVDRSVYETVHTMLPSLVRIFAGSSDEVCKFVPVGPEDEQNATQTTAYVNHVITQKNAWEQICADWIFDALLFPNSYAMAYWDESENIQREVYQGQTPEQVALLMQDDELTVLQHTEYEGAPIIDPATGQAQPQSLHDIVAERTNKKGQAKICVLPAEHCIVDGDTPSWMLRDAKFFEYREKKSIAELRDMGLDVDEDIGDAIDLNTNEDQARDRLGENTQEIRENGEGVLRKVTTRMIWIYADCEGNEKARMYYAILVGRTVLHSEPCGRIMVSSMTAQPMPHRHPGMSIAESIRDLQDVGTAITRGGLDNLYLANNGRYAISDKVNLSDFLDSRPGGAIRLTDGALPGQGHIVPLEHPFAFDKVIGSLEYFDQKRQNRVGTSRYFSGTDAGAINKTASGIQQLTNASAQRVEHVARMMAPAVEELFSICHELLLKHANKKEIIQIKGEWVPVDPACWQTKRDVRISVGVGAGNKDSLIGALNMTFQEQLMLAQTPMNIVKPENIYATQIEKAKLMGYANPEKFYTNPAQQPPQQQPPPPELVKIQAEMQDREKQRQFDGANSERDRQLEQWKTQTTTDTQKQIAALNNEMKMQLENHRVVLDTMKQEHAQHMDKLNAHFDAFGRIHDMHMAGQELAAKADESKRNAEKGTADATKAVQEIGKMIQGRDVVGVEMVKGPDGKKVIRRKRADGTVDEVPYSKLSPEPTKSATP